MLSQDNPCANNKATYQLLKFSVSDLDNGGRECYKSSSYNT